MDQYDPHREMTETFVSRVCDWIERTGEVFIVLRYLHSGHKDFLFCRTQAEFLKLIEVVPIGTDTIVFERMQLPLRGIYSDTFIERALEAVPDGGEYLIARTTRFELSNLDTSGVMGDSHAGLKEDLREFLGQAVAFGPCPNFVAPDNKSMISASKGGIDGPR